MVTQGPSPALISPRPLRQAPTSSSQPSLDDIEAADGVPKENTSPANLEPPPAYTPPIRTRLQENIAVALLANNPALAERLRSMPLPLPQSLSQQLLTPAATVRAASSLDPDEEPLEELSPISMRLSTRVNVARDNNIVALPCTPDEQAKSIAEAILTAFKGASVSGNGIPMIDQDGRPREVRIEVDAGITVEGANNVVGTEAAVMDVMRARHAVLRQRMASVSAAGPSEPSVAGRRRSVATAAEEKPPAKRRRE